MKNIIDRAQTRGHANHGWLDTNHTFSFASYYNPQRMHFGVMRVLNDDTITPTKGFDLHPHEDMEIISIPLKGRMRHGDSLNNSDVISKGQIQVMSAGTGIMHIEYNDSDKEDLSFLQIWIYPKTKGTKPRYNNYDVSGLLKKNDISLFLSPNNEAYINQDAWISWANVEKDNSVNYNLYGKNTGVYVFVLEGELEIDGVKFSQRDGVGISETDNFEIKALEKTEAIFFEVAMN
ncbi:MAG: pirin family protein [Bacteroidaceae bacterium]|nr:pirin family protein [Bacteroidales bacterium]MEA4966678.1 pirin family protein [Bacteroidaceae bacterium]MEA5099742.1 pirin family protein [Bacteroidales bacterium]